MCFWSPACGYFRTNTNGTHVCAGGHAWSRCRSRSWSRSKCQVLMCYARYPFGFELRKKPKVKRQRERENLLSSLTALPVQWLITNEAIKWLLTKCLSARLSNVSKFQCAVSASQICTTASAGCIPPSTTPFHTHSFWHVPHVCHTLVTCVFITTLCLS